MSDGYVIRMVEARGTLLADPDLQPPEPGDYLRSYDPDGRDGYGLAIFTADLDKALRFRSPLAAMLTWRAQSTVRPLREDEEPNRPLTAFTVEIDQL